MSSVFLRSFPGPTSFGGRFDVSTPVAKRNPSSKRARLGRAFLIQMLVSGTALNNAPTRRREISRESAIVEEQPTVRTPLLNGVVDDWSGEPATRDWDGREVDGGAQNLPALAGLLAVAGVGYFCTRAVGGLVNRRAELARIVPHPVAFSASPAASIDASSPRSSMSDDVRLRSRPLSPNSLGIIRTEDRGTSPVPADVMERSTSMGSLTRVNSVRDAQTSEFDDDAISMTSAADAIDVESTVSSMESSDLGSLDMQDVITRNRGMHSELPQFRSMSPELVQKLPQEFISGTLRERAILAMKAANAATEAAQRASAFSAAASTASATASKASSQAMAAAALAHIALESGNLEQMTTAQAEAWKAVQIAAEAESRSAEAAALATAYEDLAEQQAKVARELSQRPPSGFFQTVTHAVSDFFSPITDAIVGMTSAMMKWLVSVWTYFSSGTCWHQFCSFCRNSVSFIHGILVTFFIGIKDAILYIVHKVTGFCTYVGNGIMEGLDSCMRFFRVLYTRIFNPKGSIGGDATA